MIESLTSYTNVNFSMLGGKICHRQCDWLVMMSFVGELLLKMKKKKLATPPLESAIVQFLFRSHAYLLRNVVRLCAGVAYVLSYAFAIPLLLFLLLLRLARFDTPLERLGSDRLPVWKIESFCNLFQMQQAG